MEYLPGKAGDRIDFLDCPVDSFTMPEAVDHLCHCVEKGQFHQIVPVNANKLWQMAQDPKLADIVKKAEMVIPEYAVVWGAKKLGTPLRGHVGGVMLLKEILPVANEKGFRLYFLGAKDEVVNLMVENLRKQYEKLQIVGWHNGYLDAASEAKVLTEIQTLQPDMLFVAMGTPRQEYWIRQNRDQLPVSVCMGVGGSFDVLAGIKKDAPAWTRKGFEWLYRLVQDPRNLWKRYLITNPWFVYHVFCAKFFRKK